MENKVALVTGSTSGIGLATAHKLASLGCHIILTGLGDDQLIHTLLAEFKKRYKGKVDYVYADLAVTEDILNLWRNIKDIYPEGIDILINVAGFHHKSPVEEMSTEKWDVMIAVMLSAPFHLIKHSLPDMKKKDWGRIVNMSSVMGLAGRELGAAYNSAKHGLIGLTKVVALETATFGVTCNAICPGSVNTPDFQKVVQALADKKYGTTEEALKYMLSSQPSGKFVPVDEVASLVAYMCSDSASQMTGSAVNLDGGYLAQ